jgi:hypothetical protein
MVCTMLRTNSCAYGNSSAMDNRIIDLSNYLLVLFTKAALAIRYQRTILFSAVAQKIKTKTKSACSLLVRTQLNVSRQKLSYS